MDASLRFWLIGSLCASVFFGPSAKAQSVVKIEDASGLALPHAVFHTVRADQDYAIAADGQGLIQLPDSLFSSNELGGDIRYVGMVTQEVRIPRRSSVTVKLMDDAIYLEGMVVTGQYGPTHAERSVHRISVITAAEVEASGAQSLNDVLKHAGDIQIQSDAVLGSGISMQGLDGRNVKITIDEVPVVGRLDGKLDLGQIDIEDIERIEIVKGPMSVSYGTDAIAGVINIITKKAKEQVHQVSLLGELSSEGQYDFRARLSSRKDRYGYSMRAGRRFFDGWSPGDKPFQERSPVADERRDRSWNQKEQYLFGFEQTRYGKRAELGHRMSLIQETLKDRGAPIVNDASERIIALDDVYRTIRFDNTLRYVRKIQPDMDYSGFLAFNYFQRERTNYLSDLTGVDSQEQAQDLTSYTALTSRHTFSHAYTDRLRTQFGIDASWEASDAARLSGHSDFWQAAGFLSMEWEPMDGLLFRPGVRAGYHSLFKTPLVPNLALRYRKGPHTLRASYGEGFRSPAFKELYLAFFDSNHNVYGNPDLSPERSRNLALSHSYTYHRGDNHLSSEASLYYNKVYDLISLVQDGIGTDGLPPFTYLNLDQVITQGGRISIGFDRKSWSMHAGVGRMGLEQEDNDTLLIPLQYTNQFNASLGYTFEQIGIESSVNFTYNGAQDRVIIREDGLEPFYQSGYSLFDVAFSKNLWNKKLKIGAGIRNILDVTDLKVSGGIGSHQGESGSTLLATGRNYFFSLKYSLSLAKKGTDG